MIFIISIYLDLQVVYKKKKKTKSHTMCRIKREYIYIQSISTISTVTDY